MVKSGGWRDSHMYSRPRLVFTPETTKPESTKSTVGCKNMVRAAYLLAIFGLIVAMQTNVGIPVYNEALRGAVEFPLLNFLSYVMFVIGSVLIFLFGED